MDTPITTVRAKRPNALHPDRMTAAERRAALCGLLALGLIRLKMREQGELSDETGERVRYTLRPTNAVMGLQLTGETHDDE